MKATTQVTLITTDQSQKDSVWLVGLPLLCVLAFSYLLSSESRRPLKTFAEKAQNVRRAFLRFTISLLGLARQKLCILLSTIDSGGAVSAVVV